MKAVREKLPRRTRFSHKLAAKATRRVRVAHHECDTRNNGADASVAGGSSTSAADTSSSSGSSTSSSEDHSWYDDDSDEAAVGILEDFTDGVDAWLEDVPGAGREAFFGLFKRDATPQFCRPSLEVIGRHGIGSNFIDGEPNIKYLPQRPVELHEIVAPPPPASPPLKATAAATSLKGNHAKKEACRPERPRPRRPQTADGRDIEAARHQIPFLDDPADPVMIAHRRMERPKSPRRDFLMRCAEKQLLPVPVINRALKLDPCTDLGRKPSRSDDVRQGHDADEEGSAVVGGAIQESQRHGCIVLRHYYLGAARAKCLESAIASVPVALREVELVDSGLDDLASEALLGVLLGKVGSISKLNLSRNRMGVKGATVLARYIARKDCALRTLNLDGNKAGDQPITVVLKALSRHQPPVSHLGLSDNRLTLKTMQGCAGPLLTGGLALLSVDLGWNHLNQQAVEELSDALAWNKTVKQMNLEFNNSGDGVHALAEALQHNKTLTRLDLTANQVRWGGAVALSEAMATNVGLRSLVLRENNIGTAAGLQMGIALARKPGATCLVDIQGCTCFSDKTDVWRGMAARMRAARAARIAAVRKRNRAIRARKKLRASKKNEKTTNTKNSTSEKGPGTNGNSNGRGKKTPGAVMHSTPPVPPPTRPDEQLYWLDLTVDHKWDLRLNRPFDRAVGGEVLRTFNFSSGGSLVGILRVPGAPPRKLVFLRREGLLLREENARMAVGAVSTSPRGRQSPLRGAKKPVAVGRANARGAMAGNKKAGNKTAPPRKADHPLARWLNEWNEHNERGWEGDVPPVGGLSLREETSRLLAQLPTEGTLQLSYTAGKLLCPKQSLLVDVLPEEASETPQQSASANTNTPEDQLVTSMAVMKPGRAAESPNTSEADGSRRVGSGPGGHGRSTTAGGRAVESGGGMEGGFGGLIYMLRSLGSPMQMCEMVECLSRRTWLTDQQLCALSDAFSDEPRMSEPRCRVFLALLPNIRHNCLRSLGDRLSQRVKRLQGIPPPDFSGGAPKKGAAAARARYSQRGAKAMKTDEQRRAEEDEEAKRRARLLDDGWKEGPFFQDFDDDFVGLLAGCSVSTFRRLGLEGFLTPLEAARLGRVVEGTAYFNPFAPQGHYNLDMTRPGDRDVFRAILGLDKVNRAHVGMQGLLDPSQHGNSHHLRNFRLGGGRPVKFGLLSRRARAKLQRKGKGVKKASKKSAAKDSKQSPDAKTADKASAAAKTKSTPRPKTAKSQPKSAPKPRTAKSKPKRQGKHGPESAASSTKKKDKQPQSTAKPSGTPGLVKRYPTMPTVSRISFDFLHYIRPPAQATPTPKESFEQLVRFLTRWQCRHAVNSNGEVADSGLNEDGNTKNGDGSADEGDGGNELVQRKRSHGLMLSLLRNLCHVFYFDCNQVVDLLRIFPGDDDARAREQPRESSEQLPSSKETDQKAEEDTRSSCREEAFIAAFCRITDESNLDLCLGMLSNREVSRCEARLGPVALFMPTKPEGEYKLDLRVFADRQIVALLLELERKDPTLQLLGMRHDGKYLEEGSASWSSGVPKRGRFRTRAVTRRAFKTQEQLVTSEAARWAMARSKLGWHERMPEAKCSSRLCTEPLPRTVTLVGSATGAASTTVEAGADDNVHGDSRPRKRAVVRIPRKHKGTTAKNGTVLGVSTAPRRVQSFSHLPRPRLSRVDFIRYLDDRATEAHARDSDPMDGGADNGGSVAKGVLGAEQNDIIRKDGDPHVSRANVMVAEEELGSGVVGGDVASGEVMPPKHLLRRWPSSADIGMVTDGR
eukprot:g8759.t1